MSRLEELVHSWLQQIRVVAALSPVNPLLCATSYYGYHTASCLNKGYVCITKDQLEIEPFFSPYRCRFMKLQGSDLDSDLAKVDLEQK